MVVMSSLFREMANVDVERYGVSMDQSNCKVIQRFCSFEIWQESLFLSLLISFMIMITISSASDFVRSSPWQWSWSQQWPSSSRPSTSCRWMSQGRWKLYSPYKSVFVLIFHLILLIRRICHRFLTLDVRWSTLCCSTASRSSTSSQSTSSLLSDTIFHAKKFSESKFTFS